MKKLIRNNKLNGILTSLIIGFPIGYFFITFTYSIPARLTGEGMAYLLIKPIYGKAILGLLISFIFSLLFAGYLLAKDTKNKNLIKSSFLYSLRVNIIIWTTFIVVTSIVNAKDLQLIYLLLPFACFVLSTIGSTFSVGLLISFIVKKLNTTQV